MRLGSPCWELLLAVGLITGCVTPVASDPAGGPGAVLTKPVVIAVLDTGLSPYYPVFATPDDSWVTAHTPAVTRVVFEPDDGGGSPIDRDSTLWESLEPLTLYHFGGTRLLGISFDIERSHHYVRDANFHGAATSFLAAAAASSAIVVVVQVDDIICTDPSCIVQPSVADGMEWIAAQEWIDVVSISLGMPGNAPDRKEAHADMERFLSASARAARDGKLIVNSAGNEPTVSVTDYFSGPPWVIAIGGAEIAAHGERPTAAKTVDVVANFTEFVPMYGDGTDDMQWRSGTSLGTPIVAGTLAHALALVRTADPTMLVTAQMLRDAMNASAVYFSPTEWDPTPPGREPLPDDLRSSLSIPVVAQAQMGWGYVEAALAPEIARRILENDLGVPAGKEHAAIFQPRWQQAREDYWSAYGS